MLASKRSCWTTFFMATRLEEPDIFAVIWVEKKICRRRVVWVGFGAGCWDKSTDDDIRIPVVHTCDCNSSVNTLVGVVVKTEPNILIKNIFIDHYLMSIYASLKLDS